MATSLWKLLNIYEVVIPIVQRDYAQGRALGKVPAVRERFLNALRGALLPDGKAEELDFIYGYIHANGQTEKKRFVPLDGQQRLTTLFLLHWYAAAKERQLTIAEKPLSNFTYETRHSSRVFCSKLVGYKPETFLHTLSKSIQDEPWFFTSWINDPTISGMLTMVDAIHEKFHDVHNLWSLLTSDNPRISFHLLPMEQLGLPDELYIKMNSRGKELTEFEHFKSRFSGFLESTHRSIFNEHVDQKWSDLFWNLYKNRTEVDIAKLVDQAFLRFLRFATDLLISLNNINRPNEMDVYSYGVYKTVYSDPTHVETLFTWLNVLSETYLQRPGFFGSLFYIESEDFEKNKTRLFFNQADVDLFRKCANSYDQHSSGFSLGEQLMLYACILHFTNGTEEFPDRIRTLRNLIAQSEDLIRREKLPGLLENVTRFILQGELDGTLEFNTRQVEEELNKKAFIINNLELKPVLHKLEDHHLLQGCLMAFDINSKLPHYAEAFHKVFYKGTNYETISRTLLCYGDYTQSYNGWLWRMGNHSDSTWRELLTPSKRRGGYDKTKEVLGLFLGYCIQNPEKELFSIITNYLTQFETNGKLPKDWRYYYVKYSGFRRNEDGFYSWYPDESKRYEFMMMRRSTYNGFHWSPFLFTMKEQLGEQVMLENYGAPLVVVKGGSSIMIKNKENGYLLESTDGGELVLESMRQRGILDDYNVFPIAQNDEGFDIEDRVVKGIELVAKIESWD